MWSTYTTSKPVNLNKLETLPHRSHPVPFTFHLGHVHEKSFHLEERYEDIGSMLHRHAERLRSLAMHDLGRGFIDDLLSKQLPLLEQLIVPCGDVNMPGLRKRTLNGRLRHLHVRGLRFPGPCGSLPSVRSLTCVVVDMADMRRLFEIFPRIEEVHLLRVTKHSRLPERLPPSLRSLELHATQHDLVNYSALIRPWIGRHHLRHLGLQHCSTTLPALRFFVEECNEPWSMKVTEWTSGYTDVLLRSEDKLTVGLSIRTSYTVVDDLLNVDPTLVQNLTSLTIPASALEAVIVFLLPQFSSVTHLEIILLDNSECMALERQQPAPYLIRIPHLRTVAFICGTNAYIWGWASPARQRCLLPLATRLESIIISTPHYDELRDHDWTGFQRHADIVSVVDGTSRAKLKPLFQEALSDVYQIDA
ncbi:hypothetical protein EXIGLDRAFT_66831 [Exidia glandulosa HHB12029]|uniref:F-box domain-containing protein n=1 Tax=Exidia glandulosa HHB12029 TaxID=1314781 RepID=A0A165I2H6_EXIGL|nr:hypothetical protein EXIGLDRAFT_66831 [Exidia glandulosa HHB12029]